MIMLSQIVKTALEALTAYLQTHEKEAGYRMFYRSQREEEHIQREILNLTPMTNEEDPFEIPRAALQRKLRMQQHVTANLARSVGISLDSED